MYSTLTGILYCFFPRWVRHTQAKAAMQKLHRVIENWSQDKTKSQRLYLLLCAHAGATVWHPYCYFSPFNFVLEWDISISGINSAFILSIFQFAVAFILFLLFIFRLCSENQRGVWGTALTYDWPERRLFGIWQRGDHTWLHLHNICEGPFSWNLQQWKSSEQDWGNIKMYQDFYFALTCTPQYIHVGLQEWHRDQSSSAHSSQWQIASAEELAPV